MTAPVTNEYPYGTFDTLWTREFFGDEVVFNWFSEPSRTIDVQMERTDVEPDYQVLSDFLYDALRTNLQVTAWIERSGKIIENPTSVSVEVYDETGALVHTMSSSTPLATGVFFMDWQILSSLPNDKLLFAKTTIVLSGVPYTSGINYKLRLPSDSSELATILSAIQQARDQVSSNVLVDVGTVVNTVDSNVVALSTAQSAFRTEMRARVGGLETNIDVVASNIAVMLPSVTNFPVIPSEITNIVSVASNVALLVNAQTNMQNLVENIRANILFRPGTLLLNQSETIWFRSRPGLTPTLTVYDSGGSVVESGAMSESTPGMYSRSVSASWGLGEYTIAVNDGTYTDRITVKVSAPAVSVAVPNNVSKPARLLTIVEISSKAAKLKSLRFESSKFWRLVIIVVISSQLITETAALISFTVVANDAAFVRLLKSSDATALVKSATSPGTVAKDVSNPATLFVNHPISVGTPAIA